MTLGTAGRIQSGQGFFSRERNAWTALVLYIILLYSTLTLVYDLYLSVFNSFGEAWVRGGLSAIFLAIGAGLAAPAFRRIREDVRRLVPLTMIVATLFYALLDIDVPANQIHFLQYGPLSLLALEAVRFRIRDRQLYSFSLLIVTLVGIGDELLQGILPDRRFDPHDVLLNSLAGLLTLSFLGFVWRRPQSETPAEKASSCPTS